MEFIILLPAIGVFGIKSGEGPYIMCIPFIITAYTDSTFNPSLLNQYGNNEIY